MVNAQLIPVPAFTDNYIWMLYKNGRAIVVDPGQSAPVEQALEHHKLTLDSILLTHHHHDHVGGVLALQQRTGAVVYGPASETLPACDHRLREGDTVQLPAVGLQLTRSEEHTSELQSLMRISSAVFCLKNTTTKK